MKILVIDDDHLVLYTLTRILERNGYEVVTVRTAGVQWPFFATSGQMS